MPDISMCQDKYCPLREHCYRQTAIPNEYQWYAGFQYKDGVCEDYIPAVKGRKNE